MIVRDDAGDAHAGTKSIERTNASTTSGSNAWPEPSTTHACASSNESRGRYGPVARQCVEDVCHCDDAPREWNLLALEAAWVTAPVPALVMRPGDGGGKLEQLATGVAEQIAANLGVLLHHLRSSSVSIPVLLRIRSPTAILPMSCSGAAKPSNSTCVSGNAERSRDVSRVGADALEMRARGAVVVLDCTAQPAQRPCVRALKR